MDRQTFANISKIIERDSKSTTYKFALLRGTIDLINDNSPFIIQNENRVYLPVGLLVEKWLLYYYPIFSSEAVIPQINGDAGLAFGPLLKQVTEFYRSIGGFSAFYNDLKNKGLPAALIPLFTQLARLIARTITNMPMRYIGKSVTGLEYSLYHYHKNSSAKAVPITSTLQLVDTFGTFSIPVEYYEAFKILGSFIGGQDAILFKWANFSVQASGKRLSVEHVLCEVLQSPVTTREITASKTLYKDILTREGKVHCVWSGQQLSRYDIDHIIPFAVWKNNDLWNLLPVHPAINNKKRDKIPAAGLIDKQQELIITYWEILNRALPTRFQNELQIALLGYHQEFNWQETAIHRLKESCTYLTATRGFDEWC
jgi:hypothetical protein